MICLRLPNVRIVPQTDIDELRSKLATESFWRYVDSLNDQPAPKRDPVPTYLRVFIDDDFIGPIG